MSVTPDRLSKSPDYIAYLLRNLLFTSNFYNEEVRELRTMLLLLLCQQPSMTLMQPESLICRSYAHAAMKCVGIFKAYMHYFIFQPRDS